LHGRGTINFNMMAASVQSKTQWTILEILQWTVDYFSQKGIENPRLTAEVLLAHLLQHDRMYLYVHYNQPLEQHEREQFKTLIRQRVQGVPTQYITGKQEFWSLEFQVEPGVLIPRPETEHLVEAAIQHAKSFSQPRILDLGTGSGAIAISLQHELPDANVYAGDISGEAVAIAMKNADRLLQPHHRLSFAHGDLFAPFQDMTFDLIVSNPPYIAADEYAALAREIKEHEPKSALYAGEHGLDIYRRLIAEAPSYLAAEGVVLVEIGYGQHDAVAALFQDRGFIMEETIQDYAGIERVIAARLRGSET